MARATGTPLDFAGLCELEPRLRDLEKEARSIEDDGRRVFFCSNYVWMPLNGDLRALVGVARLPQPGDDADGPLYDSRSYELAFEALSPLLPPCRGCGCRLFQPTRDEQIAGLSS